MTETAPQRDQTFTVEDVHQSLIPVLDPELGYSVVELGLVRGIQIDLSTHTVVVRLTLTSPMCPMGPEIIGDVKRAARHLPGVDKVEVELVWSPPWDPRTDASEDVKADFGIWD